MRGKRILINPIDDYIGGDFIMANIKDEAMKYGKSGTIEYKMPEKMARELLKARKGEEAKMREYAKTTQILFLALGLLTGATLFLMRDAYISIYNISPDAVAHARTLINVISITIIGTCYQAACLFGLVKSGGDVSFVFKNDLIFVFLVVLPSAIIATALSAPPWVVFACLKCDQILKCFVAAVKINRFRWMKNLTRKSEQ